MRLAGLKVVLMIFYEDSKAKYALRRLNTEQLFY